MYQPTQPPPRKRHIFRWILAGIGGFITLIIIVAVAAGGSGSKPPNTATAQPATSSDSAAPADPVAAPATTAPASPSPTTVEFNVSGTGAPSIMYGSGSDHRNAPGKLGILGDGNALPYHTTMPYDPAAQYYSLNAQLEGDSGGDITCSIVVTGPRMAPLTVSHGHASGGSSICSAQAAPSADGTSWQNES